MITSIPRVFLRLLPALSLALLGGSPLAGTFDQAGAKTAAVPAERFLSCDLVKTSFKGDNEGWISSAEKSVESTCLAGDKPIKFSSTADNWSLLLEAAGQPVSVTLARNNGLAKDAKTDWIMLTVKPKSETKPAMEKLCGDDKAAKEFDEVWSHGYRVGFPVDVWKGDSREEDDHWAGPQGGHKDAWYLDVRMSRARNWQWAADGSVRLGKVCEDLHDSLASGDTPLVFVYDQGDEDPEYAVVEIYRMK